MASKQMSNSLSKKKGIHFCSHKNRVSHTIYKETFACYNILRLSHLGLEKDVHSEGPELSLNMRIFKKSLKRYLENIYSPSKL